MNLFWKFPKLEEFSKSSDIAKYYISCHGNHSGWVWDQRTFLNRVDSDLSTDTTFTHMWPLVWIFEGGQIDNPAVHVYKKVPGFLGLMSTIRLIVISSTLKDEYGCI